MAGPPFIIPASMNQPYSIGIFISPKDPDAIKPEVHLYGAEERAVFETDRKEALAAGWRFIGHWQPAITEGGGYHRRDAHVTGYYTDAYGAVRLTVDGSLD